MAAEKNILNFAYDLYSYISRKPKQDLNDENVNDLNLKPNQNEKKSFQCTESIRDAVLTSQFFLRNYCLFCFNKIGEDLTYSHTLFNICVYNVIFNWIANRSDVFIKFLDSAAIIAESILFCKSERNVAFDEEEAPEMFANFFENYLAKDFYRCGGWDRFRARAFMYCPYVYLLSDRLPNKVPEYKKTEYNCRLIEFLAEAPVMFPVESSAFCENCTDLQCSVVKELCFDTTLLSKLKQVPLDDCATSCDVWRCLNFADKLTKRKSAETQSQKLDVENGEPEYFACRFLGGECRKRR